MSRHVTEDEVDVVSADLNAITELLQRRGADDERVLSALFTMLVNLGTFPQLRKQIIGMLETCSDMVRGMDDVDCGKVGKPS